MTSNRTTVGESPIDWIRLVEILAESRRTVGHGYQPRGKGGPWPRGSNRGWSWACYCRVCSDLRRLTIAESGIGS